jgi:hypothetical protein
MIHLPSLRYLSPSHISLRVHRSETLLLPSLSHCYLFFITLVVVIRHFALLAMSSAQLSSLKSNSLLSRADWFIQKEVVICRKLVFV